MKKDERDMQCGLSLLLSKNTKFNILIQWMNCYQQYICLHKHMHCEEIWDLRDIYLGAETTNSVSAPPFLLIPGRAKIEPTGVGINH